jgi:uncharacterized protein YdeI (YjbR/CyaY-like superfamily)
MMAIQNARFGTRRLDTGDCSRFVPVRENEMDAEIGTRRLTREVHEMPDDVRAALTRYKVMDAYRRRPAYQQNDYIGWIIRAKLPATRQKRLDQMLAELESGDVYMHMKWSG